MDHHQRKSGLRRSSTISFGLLIACVCFLGCGGDSGSDKATATVTITIQNGGEPVTSGRVELETDRPGEGSGGDLNSSGVATLRGVTIGDYSVIVAPPVIVQVPGVPVEKKPDQSAFPEKFRTRQTSPLKIHVEEGSTSKTFDLKEAT